MKTIKLLILLSIFGLFSANTFAATIEKIEAIDNNTIELTASTDVVFSDTKVEGEVKLLKDVPVSYSAKDTENKKKVLVNLSTDLGPNTSYSLITILGWEWNIDFRTNDALAWEYSNTNLVVWEQWVEKVNIIDSRTMEIYFSNDLTADTFEFKILSEIETSGIKSSWNNIVDIEVAKNIEKSTNYIVMILSLKDATWNQLQLSEDLYDLVTPDDLVQAVPEEQVVVTDATIDTGAIMATDIDTNTWNVVEVAKQTSQTPETGTTTSILIMVALLAGLGFYFRKSFATK